MRDNFLRRIMAGVTLISFMALNVLPLYAQAIPSGFTMTAPGYNPAILKGIQIYLQSPLKMDFILDPADSGLQGDALKKESNKLIKYFLASLTTPEDEMWVNLSPLEPDRIIPRKFGETEMGRDLLSLDYLLKQTASALTDPEKPLGTKFWDKVYAQAYAQFGVTDVPVDMINKVWITPEDATVYENGDKAFVVGTKLKVMLEADYLAMQNGASAPADHASVTDLSDQLMREVIIPVLEQEVNEGRSFAPLRQIYYSMILATWFKRNLRESLLGKVYVDQNKTPGVDIADKEEKTRIYHQYLEAFKQGAYNFIKEQYDPVSRETVPRKYFSGGLSGIKNAGLKVLKNSDDAQILGKLFRMLTVLTLMTVSVTLESVAAPRPGTQRDPLLTQVSSVYGWGKATEDSLRQFRSRVGPGFEGKTLQEKVIALAYFIKSARSLGVTYDMALVRNYDLILQGGSLDRIVVTKRAICLGFSRLFTFLMGQSADIVEVMDVGSRQWTHAMNIIHVGGGKVQWLDLSTNTQDGFIMTRPFVLDEYYKKVSEEGIYSLQKRLPFDNQNFRTREDLNKKYSVIKFGQGGLSYNREFFYNRYSLDKSTMEEVFKAGNVLFSQAKYAEAIVKYTEGATRAAALRALLSRDIVVYRYVIKDIDGFIAYCRSKEQIAKKNIQAAEHNQNLGKSNSSGSGNTYTFIIQPEDKQSASVFFAGIKTVNSLMTSGVNAANGKWYAASRNCFQQVLQMIARLKTSSFAKKYPDVIEKARLPLMAKAAEYNLDQLKQIDKAERVGGIDLNARNLKIQSIGKKADMSYSYQLDSLGHIAGLTPVIMSMRPVADVAALLGIK